MAIFLQCSHILLPSEDNDLTVLLMSKEKPFSVIVRDYHN
ncbi:hypothetical protein CSC05_3458 [Escherichia coli]|nr:hypothetical protein CSC05_3458 [Escherichia coli]